MSLHRASEPDWKKVAPEKRNIWQRGAAATKGAVAPANIVSLLGAGLSVWGLFLLLDGRTFWWGVGLIIIGRLADIADGYIADYTGTKSPFGEATDATVDKIVLGLGLVFLIGGKILPFAIAVILLAHTVYNTLVGFAGYFKRFPVHPSLLGKYTAAAEWVCIGLFIVVYGLSPNSTAQTVFEILAWISVAAFLALAIPSSYVYARDFIRNVRHEAR